MDYKDFVFAFVCGGFAGFALHAVLFSNKRERRKTTRERLHAEKRCAAEEFCCPNKARYGKMYCEEHYYFEEVRRK